MRLQFAWNTVNWQVVVHEMEVASLDLIKQFVTSLTNESVIVLSLDVDDELFVAHFGTLGQSHHSLKSNGSLECYRMRDILRD